MRKAGWVLAAVMAGGLAAAGAPRRDGGSARPDGGTAARALPEQEFRSPLARALLKERMGQHGHEMGELVRAVVLLDWVRARALAEELSREPELAPSREGGAGTDALLTRFEALDEDLRQRARALARAAEAQDVAQAAQRLNDLTAACMACHAAYRAQAPR